MRIILVVAMLLCFFVAEEQSEAKTEKKKKVTYRKTQEVSFDGDDVEGVKRNPYGAYLAQKRGVDFAPLYNIREKFETNIKSSSEYIK